MKSGSPAGPAGSVPPSRWRGEGSGMPSCSKTGLFGRPHGHPALPFPLPRSHVPLPVAHPRTPRVIFGQGPVGASPPRDAAFPPRDLTAAKIANWRRSEVSAQSFALGMDFDGSGTVRLGAAQGLRPCVPLISTGAPALAHGLFGTNFSGPIVRFEGAVVMDARSD